VRGSKSAMS